MKLYTITIYYYIYRKCIIYLIHYIYIYLIHFFFFYVYIYVQSKYVFLNLVNVSISRIPSHVPPVVCVPQVEQHRVSEQL